MPLLSIRHLEVQLNEKTVLRDVSFDVASGHVVCVIGPNGSGKSTLLRTLSGLIPQTSGEILWREKPLPSSRTARARMVALLPQNVGSGSEMTVDEMAMLGRTPFLPPYGVPSIADRLAADAALTAVAPDLRGRNLDELSGGERQRATLARPLATQAPILLLDEPISALDLRFQHEILGLVRRLTRERQLSTICVLHDLNLAALVADAMLLLDSTGRVVASGTPEQVMTEAHLSRVYEVPLRITTHPLSNKPQAQSLWVFDEPVA